MPALTTPICDFGWNAPDFELLGTDGIYHSFASIHGENGTLVMFICNHCPYVKSVIHRIVEDCKILQENGIGIIAVMSNDVNDPKYGYEDSFDKMQVAVITSTSGLDDEPDLHQFKLWDKFEYSQYCEIKKELIEYISELQEELLNKPLSVYDICQTGVDKDITKE